QRPRSASDRQAAASQSQDGGNSPGAYQGQVRPKKLPRGRPFRLAMAERARRVAGRFVKPLKWVGHASRVLASASRDRGLSLKLHVSLRVAPTEKCFGATPKPAHRTCALPGLTLLGITAVASHTFPFAHRHLVAYFSDGFDEPRRG